MEEDKLILEVRESTLKALKEIIEKKDRKGEPYLNAHGLLEIYKILLIKIK